MNLIDLLELTSIEKELKKLEAKLHRRRNILDRMEMYNLELEEELSKLEAGDWKGVFIRAKDEERQLKNEILLVRYDEEIIQNKINERQTEAQKITQEICATSNALNEQVRECWELNMVIDQHPEKEAPRAKDIIIYTGSLLIFSYILIGS